MNKLILLLYFSCLLLLSACSDVVQFFKPYPNNKEALQAINNMLKEGVSITSIELPQSFLFAEAEVKECNSTSTKLTYKCKVALSSSDIPILGKIALTIDFRFSKKNDQWVAHLY